MIYQLASKQQYVPAFYFALKEVTPVSTVMSYDMHHLSVSLSSHLPEEDRRSC